MSILSGTNRAQAIINRIIDLKIKMAKIYKIKIKDYFLRLLK